MNSAFHHLALTEVRPGMVLSDDLLDKQGQMLLPQGAILSAAIIALLPRHGIDRIAVVPSSTQGAAPAAIDEAAVTARLTQLFRHCGELDEPGNASAALLGCIRAYRLGHESAP